MKYLLLIILSGLLLIAAVPKLKAHELGTHARMTNAAYNKSILADAEFIKLLGIENGEEPFGGAYYDILGSNVQERNWQKYEQEKKRMPDGARPLSIEGWLMRGAIREDDLGLNAGEDPKDDPYGNFFRVFNHFYDPHFNRPLTIGGVCLGECQMNPNWALGTSNNGYLNPLLTANYNSASRNHFNVFNAMESQYRALTGHSGEVVATTKDVHKRTIRL